MCCEQSTGLPKGREPYDDGASIVVSGRESRLHGHRGVKGAQGRSEAGFPWTGRQGTRDAESRNVPEHTLLCRDVYEIALSTFNTKRYRYFWKYTDDSVVVQGGPKPYDARVSQTTNSEY